ncbi:MAG: ribonuclease T, partial [Pontixanthobacter sp.]
PEGRADWPQWCSTQRTVAPAEARRNMCMMPSARLVASQWAKHGSCMVSKPETYFKVTRILWNGLRFPEADRLSRDDALTAGTLRDAFVAVNPDWPREAVGIDLNTRGWLQELRLCYGKDFMPVKCSARRFGPRDTVPVKIWRGL